jgi:hypothetical protein
MKRLLPCRENEGQPSVNDCWPSIMVTHSVMSPLWSIYIVLTVFIHYIVQKYLVVAREIKYSVPEDAVGICHTYLSILAAICFFMNS